MFWNHIFIKDYVIRIVRHDYGEERLKKKFLSPKLRLLISASKDRASVLKTKITERMLNLNMPVLTKGPCLDKEGRTTDASGKAMTVVKHEPTLKVLLHC